MPCPALPGGLLEGRFRVWGLGFGGYGLEVQGLGFRV